MEEIANDPYVVGKRDWWAITWRIWAANRFIDFAIIVAIFYFSGDGEIKEGTAIMMAIVIGFGAYVVVRNWVANFFIGKADEGKIGFQNLAILHALRRMKIDHRAINPLRLDGLYNLINADYHEPRDRVGAALLFGIVKGRGSLMPEYRRLAYEDSVERAILRYVDEETVKPRD